MEFISTKGMTLDNAPDEIESKITELTQQEFIEKYGSLHPNLGCIGE